MSSSARTSPYPGYWETVLSRPPQRPGRPLPPGKKAPHAGAPEGKKYSCPICFHKFERNGHLQTHIVAVHENKRPHKCNQCGQRFGHLSSLARHKKGIHKIQ